ncbi:DNA polymerase III subunit delta [Patescibacteria group bacterium]|nr:DNA polymerase III subunit delta [Patescibacteria group bacterium]
MIIFIHGEDTFRSLRRVKQLKEAFIEKYNSSGFNVIQLEASETDLDEFQSDSFTGGLLEKKRLIIIKNLVSAGNIELVEGVFDLLSEKKFPKDNILIIWEGKIEEKGKPKIKGGSKSRKSLLAQLKKEREESFPLLSNSQLSKWIQDEIKERNGKIEKRAVEELVAKVGADLWQMDSEIEKLVNYVNGQIITSKQIEEFVKSKYDENIFHLTDALGQKNKEQALRLVRDQLALGTEPLQLLSKFIWQFRNLVQVNELLQTSKTQKEIADILKLHPFVVQKTAPQAKRFTQEELRFIYQKLVDIDFELKNSQTKPELLFDLMVIEVCK